MCITAHDSSIRLERGCTIPTVVAIGTTGAIERRRLERIASRQYPALVEQRYRFRQIAYRQAEGVGVSRRADAFGLP